MLKYENLSPIRLFNIYGENKGTSFADNVYSPYTICPTLNTMGGGNRQPLIIVEVKNESSSLE